MERLKHRWDTKHPELNRFSKQNLRDRISFFKRTGRISQVLMAFPPESARSPNQNLHSAAGFEETNNLRHDDHSVEISSFDQYISLIPYGPLTQLQTNISERYRTVVNCDLCSRTLFTKFFGRLNAKLLSAVNEAVGVLIGWENVDDLWKLNSLVYAASSVAVERLKPKRSAVSQELAVVMFENQMTDIRRLIPKLTEEVNRQRQNRPLSKRLRCNRWQFHCLFYSCSITKLAEEHERLLGKLRALATKRRNAKEQLKWKSENRSFRDNARKLFRSWRGKQSTSSNPPSQFPVIEDFEKFWKSLYATPASYNKNATWLPSFKGIYEHLCANSSFSLSVECLCGVLKSMKQRSSPGPDKIIVFWWRHFSTCHPLLCHLITMQLLNFELDIPSWLPKGTTYLIPKTSEHDVTKYRPITCLNTLYKVITTIIKEDLVKHCDSNEIIPHEQCGVRRGSWGCKDNLIIDFDVCEEVKKNKRNLSVAWIDYRKAFDSVPHDWLLNVLEIICTPNHIQSFLKRVLPLWCGVLTYVLEMGKSKFHLSPSILIVVFQGDSLSPLLFCLSLVPVSQLLKQTTGYHPGPPGGRNSFRKVPHLFYMDDLNLYSSSQQLLRVSLDIVSSLAKTSVCLSEWTNV